MFKSTTKRRVVRRGVDRASSSQENARRDHRFSPHTPLRKTSAFSTPRTVPATAGCSRSSVTWRRCRMCLAARRPGISGAHRCRASPIPARERRERRRIRRVVEVADDGDVLHARFRRALVNLSHALGLPPTTLSVRVRLRAEPLLLRVIDEQQQRVAPDGRLISVFRTIAAEDPRAVLDVIDVAPHRADGEPTDNPDVDPPVVIAVDDHDVLVRFGLPRPEATGR